MTLISLLVCGRPISTATRLISFPLEIFILQLFPIEIWDFPVFFAQMYFSPSGCFWPYFFHSGCLCLLLQLISPPPPFLPPPMILPPEWESSISLSLFSTRLSIWVYNLDGRVEYSWGLLGLKAGVHSLFSINISNSEVYTFNILL